MNAPPLILVFLAAVFTHNLLLHYFLGTCPFLGCSRDLGVAGRLGLAVTFVMFCTALINHAVYHGVLVPLRLQYLSLIVFVAVIAAFVQLLEMLVERFSPWLHVRLGIFLPLTTVNCAILGVTLLVRIENLDAWRTAAFALGAGAGWTLAIVLLAGLREKMRCSDIPEPFRGVAAAMIITGVMAMAFIAFMGMIPV